jgi:hypothetical protein
MSSSPPTVRVTWDPPLPAPDPASPTRPDSLQVYVSNAACAQPMFIAEEPDHLVIPSCAFPQEGTYALRIVRNHDDAISDPNGDFDYVGAVLRGEHRLSIDIPRSEGAD